MPIDSIYLPTPYSINKFGRNTDVDAAEDIWDGGGTWAEPTAARTHQIVSTDANDTAAGTGVRTVQIYGLDDDYLLINEAITMNGTSNVATTKTYRMIHRMITRSAGSGGVAAGNITATADTDSTVTAQITAGNNQTDMAIYMTPNGVTSYITQYYGTINRKTSGGSDVTLFVKESGQVWAEKHTIGVQATGSSSFNHQFFPFLPVPAKALVKIQADASTANLDISAEFDIIGR